MSTVYWAVFLGILTGYLTVTLIEGILDEIQSRRHNRYIEYLEDLSDDFYDSIKKV